MKHILAFALLFGLGGAAYAAGLVGYSCNGWGITMLTGPSICGTSPPSTNVLLVNTGSALLVNTGSKFLIQ